MRCAVCGAERYILSVGCFSRGFSSWVLVDKSVSLSSLALEVPIAGRFLLLFVFFPSGRNKHEVSE